MIEVTSVTGAATWRNGAAGTHNLPFALTRMIGREEAVAAIVARLSGRERRSKRLLQQATTGEWQSVPVAGQQSCAI